MMKLLPLLFFVGSIKLAVAQSPVVIELFTSQGCSSCPAADKNLAEIIENAEKSGLEIVGLSFHVDYWNYIGWKDPYSKKEFTERQKKYASILNSESIYTPQMIVNGKIEFVGSDKGRSAEEVMKALRHKMQFQIVATEIKKLDDKLRISYSLDKNPTNQIINIAHVTKDVSNEITSGENSGRKLAHKNVVRSFVSASAKKEGVLEIPLSTGSASQLIIFIQDSQWQVVGAMSKTL